jgi:sugar fermentation stimulation protein A
MNFPYPLIQATLIRRYKRFLADVELTDGEVITVHCPNSGTMKTVSDPGSRVWISKSPNLKRKLPYTLELVCCGPRGVPALVNTARPNHLVRESIEQGIVTELQGYGRVRSEVKIGASRLDLLLEDGPAECPQCFVEVKNVTMSQDPGLAIFPDAVTTRGRKHLGELVRLVEQGHRAVQFFCVSREDIDCMAPAEAIDPSYAKALREASAAGVEVVAWRAQITPQQMWLERSIPVDLSPP